MRRRHRKTDYFPAMAFIACARATSFKVRPPASWVESVTSTVL